MNLSICVPARDQVHSVFALSLARLASRLTRKNIDFEIHMVFGSVIAELRNQLTKEALDQNATHILWLDTDIQFPANLADKLMSHDKDIVAANYSTRYKPYRSVAFTNPENVSHRLEEQQGLHKVWAIGMGSMLTKTSVFEQLPKPWFSHEYDKTTDTFGGEDIYFCNQAMHHGYNVYVDADIKLAHIGVKANTL